MKAVKIIAAIVLCIALLAAEGSAMGLFSVDKALSEESLTESMRDSEIIEQLVDEALAENTVNMGGRYGEIAQAVFHTAPMRDFFTAYLTSAIRTELYGNPYDEVAYDELMAAFSQGVDEVNASGQYEITAMEANFLKQAMQAEAPDLTAKLNEQIGRYETISGDLTERAMQPDKMMEKLMSRASRAIALAACMLLCASLIALYWKSRFGFLWCGVVTALAALLYGGLTVIAKKAMLSAASISASDKMTLSMITNGFGTVALAGAAVAVIFIAVFAVLKGIDRRKQYE